MSSSCDGYLQPLPRDHVDLFLFFKMLDPIVSLSWLEFLPSLLCYLSFLLPTCGCSPRSYWSFLIFFFCFLAKPCGFLWPAIRPFAVALQWMCGALTPGPPGKSPYWSFIVPTPSSQSHFLVSASDLTWTWEHFPSVILASAQIQE